MMNPKLTRQENPDDLARWYFNVYCEPMHRACGVPEEGINFMREQYVESVRNNPIAQKDIKIVLKRAISAESMVK